MSISDLSSMEQLILLFSDECGFLLFPSGFEVEKGEGRAILGKMLSNGYVARAGNETEKPLFLTDLGKRLKEELVQLHSSFCPPLAAQNADN